MKNTLGDLNLFLFSTLERLDDEDITPEKLEMEIARAKAVTQVAQQVINNGRLVLDAQKLFNNNDKLNADAKLPKMLEG